MERDHPEPNVNLTYIQQTGQTNTLTDGGDIYTGLDRFGRVIDQNWWNPSTISSTDRFQYGFDRASEVLYKNNLVAPAQSELYHASSTASGDNNTAYDLVGRLTGFARGTLSASGNNGSVMDTVASSSRSQSWSLDALGNWTGQTTNGSTTTRGFNAQNETTSVSGGTAPGYDANGNTTNDAGQTMVLDAWNRLVGVKSGSVTVAAYAYDALTRRISETYSGTATTNHLYYSPQWQVIEERQNATSASNVTFQYVWGAAYIDQMVLRDSYSGGSRTLRLYVQQDANFNVTALVSVSGAVQERYLYDPYGSVTITDASYTARSSSSYGWIYMHQSGRQDAVTGWYLFRFRDYILGEGRWAERDPLGYAAGTANLFSYISDNPCQKVDPNGTNPFLVFIIGGAAGLTYEGIKHGFDYLTGRPNPHRLREYCKSIFIGSGAALGGYYLGGGSYVDWLYANGFRTVLGGVGSNIAADVASWLADGGFLPGPPKDVAPPYTIPWGDQRVEVDNYGEPIIVKPGGHSWSDHRPAYPGAAVILPADDPCNPSSGNGPQDSLE